MFAPAQGAEGAPLSLLALLGAILAALCLALALRRIARRPDLRGALLCGLGLCLAAGATLYVHDIVSMPETVAMGAIGAGLGYLLARRAALPIARLAPPLHLAGGMVACATALAAWLNPVALGIVPGHGSALVLTAGLSGAMLILAAAAMALRPAPFVAQAGLGVLAGLSAALLGLALGNPPLILCGGVLLSAGAALVLRAIRSCRADCLH